MTSTLCRHDLDVGGGFAEEHLTPVGLVDENRRNFPQNLKSVKIVVHTSVLDTGVKCYKTFNSDNS